jgi:hypothetical protein
MLEDVEDSCVETAQFEVSGPVSLCQEQLKYVERRLKAFKDTT